MEVRYGAPVMKDRTYSWQQTSGTWAMCNRESTLRLPADVEPGGPGVALPEETAGGAAPRRRADRVSVREPARVSDLGQQAHGDDSGENLVSERARGVVLLPSLIGEQTHTRCAGTPGNSLAGDF
jgi:hypothetical protein